jgi:hypothetical protein
LSCCPFPKFKVLVNEAVWFRRRSATDLTAHLAAP